MHSRFAAGSTIQDTGSSQSDWQSLLRRIARIIITFAVRIDLLEPTIAKEISIWLNNYSADYCDSLVNEFGPTFCQSVPLHALNTVGGMAAGNDAEENSDSERGEY
jgi:hypothetical protein